MTTVGTLSGGSVRATLVALALLLVAAPAVGQVSSIGEGGLTIAGGLGWAPVGGIAQQVADPTVPAGHASEHAPAFRFMAGYHFASYLSFEAGLAHINPIRRSTPYQTTDVLTAESTLNTIEVALVGHVPFAKRARLDLSAGIADTSLHTTLSTLSGNAPPIGIPASESVRRLGAAVGADVEVRLSELVSVIAGYHVYDRVGSNHLAGSAAGTVTMALAGVHFEF